MSHGRRRLRRAGLGFAWLAVAARRGCRRPQGFLLAPGQVQREQRPELQRERERQALLSGPAARGPRGRRPEARPAGSRRDLCGAFAVAAAAAVLRPAASASAAPVYSETDEEGGVWTSASVLRRQAAAVEQTGDPGAEGVAGGPRKPLPRAFITYLARVLLNYDARSIRFWERQTPGAAYASMEAAVEKRRAQFAAFAEAVDLGIASAYGTKASGLVGLARALRGLCRQDVSAKRQIAFALSLLPPELQPVQEIEALISDVKAAYGVAELPAASPATAARATDAALRRLPQESLARRLAKLVPDALALPELDMQRSCYRPTDAALTAAAALSALEANIDGGEGFGVGAFAGSALPRAEFPELLDPLFGPLGRSPVARARQLGAQQFALLALSGAACTSAVRLVLQPLDVVKISLQLGRGEGAPGAAAERGGQAGSDDLLRAAREIVSAGGPGALYKGTDATFALTSVYGFASFGLNEFFRRSFEGWFGTGVEQANPYVLLGAPVCATLIASTVTCPLEILRVRAMDPKETRSFFGLATAAVREGVGKLWGGLEVLYLREIPFVACKFFVFDLASRALFGAFPDTAEYGAASLVVSAAAGFLSGVASALVSNPQDVLMTRIAESGGSGAASGPGEPSRTPTARLVAWMTGAPGALDLWSGLGARCAYFGAAICAQFLIYTTVKELLGVGAGDLQLVLDVFGISQSAENMMSD